MRTRPITEGSCGQRCGGLQGHQVEHCPDSLLVVNGVLGWVHRWRQHKWCNTSGPVKHVDPWIQILDLLEQLGDKVKWHVPSHMGMKGNGRADHLADGVAQVASPV